MIERSKHQCFVIACHCGMGTCEHTVSKVLDDAVRVGAAIDHVAHTNEQGCSVESLADGIDFGFEPKQFVETAMNISNDPRQRACWALDI